MLALARRTAGFTLLELLVTIAVVAIVASLAVPSFQNMIATQRVRSAANDLVTALNFARSEAVKRNAEVLVVPVGGDWSDGWVVSVAGTALQNHDAFEGLSLVSQGPDGQVSYLADGRRGDNDAITIEPPAGSGASKHCVGISPTGKPQSDSGAC